MNKRRLVTMGIAAAVGIGAGTVMARPWKSVLGVLAGDEPEACDARGLGALPSPDGRSRAVWYRRSCTAAGETLDLAVLDARGEVPNAAGNALVLDASHGEPALRVAWQSDGGLEVQAAPDAQVLARNASVGGRALRFVPLAPDAGR